MLQAAASLELEAKGGAGSLQAGAVRAGLLGDWRLVFTDSPPALKGGVSGAWANPDPDPNPNPNPNPDPNPDPNPNPKRLAAYLFRWRSHGVHVGAEDL